MNVAVIGLWHLGCVTAACLAKAGHHVTAYDPDIELIRMLREGKAPIFEPGLEGLLTQDTLKFTSDLHDLRQSSIVWVTHDTPVNDDDKADVAYVTQEVVQLFPYLQDKALVLISSQMPIGTTRHIAELCREKWVDKQITFACSPENLRLGKAIEVFTQPDRVIVGLESEADKERVQELLQPLTDNIIWMTIESAEMTKHAINAFLATSVVFINEIAALCEYTGADAHEGERGLKSESRIGPAAYLRPGGAIGGGTLLRDVHYLIDIGKQKEFPTLLYSSLVQSNDVHKQWVCRRLLHVLGTLADKKVAILGLTYKVGTDTLRRSTAVEICTWLQQQGVTVLAYDPNIQVLPESLGFIQLKSTLDETLEMADAVILATEYPEFKNLNADYLSQRMPNPMIFDASGFLAKNLSADERISYYSVGRKA